MQQDGKFLHFLKELPSTWIMLAVFLIVFAFYQHSHDQFLQRVVDTVLGGLLTLLYNRSKTPTVNAENIETVNQSPDNSGADELSLDEHFENIKRGDKTAEGEK